MITTLSNFKTRIKLDEFDTTEDTLITNLIKHCGDRFNRECNRIFERAAGAHYQFDAGYLFICPPRFPIESVTAFALKYNEADGWVALDTPDYMIVGGGEEMSIIRFSNPLDSSESRARITYTGGYVMPGGTATTGQTALPDGIEQAAIEQIASWYQNKDRLGLSSISGTGGSIGSAPMSVVTPLDLLPQVSNLLRGYQRWLP